MIERMTLDRLHCRGEEDRRAARQPVRPSAIRSVKPSERRPRSAIAGPPGPLRPVSPLLLVLRRAGSRRAPGTSLQDPGSQSGMRPKWRHTHLFVSRKVLFTVPASLLHPPCIAVAVIIVVAVWRALTADSDSLRSALNPERRSCRRMRAADQRLQSRGVSDRPVSRPHLSRTLCLHVIPAQPPSGDRPTAQTLLRRGSTSEAANSRTSRSAGSRGRASARTRQA